MNAILVFCLSLFSFPALQTTYAPPCDEVPAMNKEILATLKPYMGKKIERGECWDAAKVALNKVNAEWDGLYNFGRAYDPKKECIQPGDIVQFEKVQAKTAVKGGYIEEAFGHHTAIVYSYAGDGNLEFLHQNTGQYGKKMGVTPFDLKTVTKGKMTFYRPQAKE